MYIHTYILHFHARWGRRWAAEGEREGERGERSRCKTGYNSRQVESANDATQAGALAQSCVQAVHDSGS